MNAAVLQFPITRATGGVMDPYQNEHEQRRARDEAKSLVKEAMKELLDERDALDHERHHADHEFVRQIMNERKRRHDRWEKVKTTVLGSVILAVLGGVVSFLFWVGNLWLSTRGPN